MYIRIEQDTSQYWVPGLGSGHKPNQCIFKDRIKRVLLYQVQHCEDKGMSAKKVLQPCLINNDIWYKVMGENMRLMTSLEEDFRDGDDL